MPARTTVPGGSLSQTDTGKPSVRMGRKATDLASSGKMAGLPKSGPQAGFFLPQGRK